MRRGEICLLAQPRLERRSFLLTFRESVYPRSTPMRTSKLSPNYLITAGISDETVWLHIRLQTQNLNICGE